MRKISYLIKLANSNLIEALTGPAHSASNTYAADRDALLAKENKVGSTVVSRYDYTVNAIGQRTTVSQTGAAFPAARQIAWQYDPLGQLTQADSTEDTADRTYQYDAIGNRIKTANSLTLPSAPNYTANNLNQYTATPQPTTPTHDDDGNLTSGSVPSGAAALAWDGENRLAATPIPSSSPAPKAPPPPSTSTTAGTASPNTSFRIHPSTFILRIPGAAG